MASKRAQRRKACQGKQRHESLKEAEEIARKMRDRHCQVLRAYRCPHCTGWHVGHSKPGTFYNRTKAGKGVVK